VAAFFGQEITLEHGELQKGGTPVRCPDITKLSKLGFKPTMTFDEGLKKTLAWYDENTNLTGEPNAQ
jgi:nucleoside-diphosphate-sugar epimerase